MKTSSNFFKLRLSVMLFLILSLYLLPDSHAQTPFTPKPYYSLALNYAHTHYNPNATMYAIMSLPDIDYNTGKSHSWSYYFYKNLDTSSVDTGYVVSITIVAGMPILTGSIYPNLSDTLALKKPLSNNFCDSYLAISAAEDAGGRLFRQQFPSTVIWALISKIPAAPDTTKPYWTFVYFDPQSYYTLVIIIDGITCTLPPIGIGSNSSNLPDKYLLYQNYPNPFNPMTKIEYAIPKQGFVSLKIYDLLGREVANLVNGEMAPGYYRIDFNGSNLASGVYFYRLQSGSFIDTKRMVLIK